jgi:DNA-binding LacI/PurR family transcriptional regulator
MTRKTKLLDIAEALGVSTGTVHRALHNHPGVSTMTKTRVLQMAKTLGIVRISQPGIYPRSEICGFP